MWDIVCDNVSHKPEVFVPVGYWNNQRERNAFLGISHTVGTRIAWCGYDPDHAGENIVINDFRIGEKAVYPAHGVAEVIGIEKKEINTSVCSFYVLKVLATGMQILVPKEKADQVGLRHVATSSEIDEVFDILREKDVHIDKQTWNRRYRGFMEKIKTGSLFDVAEVYRDLYRLKSSKVLSFGERKMLDNAKQLIVKELAVARKWTEEKVEAELEKACA
jgi:CarD family transcriptional regulator